VAFRVLGGNPHLSNGDELPPQGSEHRDTSSSPRASIIPNPVLLLVLYLYDSLCA
jgi:hypothetical protein